MHLRATTFVKHLPRINKTVQTPPYRNTAAVKAQMSFRPAPKAVSLQAPQESLCRAIAVGVRSCPREDYGQDYGKRCDWWANVCQKNPLIPKRDGTSSDRDKEMLKLVDEYLKGYTKYTRSGMHKQAVKRFYNTYIVGPMRQWEDDWPERYETGISMLLNFDYQPPRT